MLVLGLVLGLVIVLVAHRGGGDRGGAAELEPAQRLGAREGSAATAAA